MKNAWATEVITESGMKTLLGCSLHLRAMEGDKDYPAEDGVPVASKGVPDFKSDSSLGLARARSLDAPRSRKVSDDQQLC